MRKLSVRSAALAAGVLALALLSGCASAESADPPVAASATADPDAVVGIDMPDLGPSPAPDPLTDEQRDALRIERQDAHWQSVAQQYPDAVRPADPFTGYTESDDLWAAINDCYVSKGFTLGTTIDAEGNSSPGGASASTEQEAIDIFLCHSEFTGATQPPNDAQLGYIYDYLTEFLVPCYEANGIENPAPPTREEFIANWPNQNWFPSTGLFGEEREYAVNKACPNTE
jgi:hypothetical protein